MKPLLLSVFACSAALFSTAASADALWAVTDASARIGISFSRFIDIHGEYGQAGREVRLSPLSIEFDRALGGRLQRTDEVEPWGTWRTYSLTVNYLLQYQVFDAQTNELLADENHRLRWYLSGWGGEPGVDDFSFNGVDGGSFIADGGVFGSSSMRVHHYSCAHIAVQNAVLSYNGSDDCGSGFFGVDARPGFSVVGDFASVGATVTLAPVPEPETYTLMALGLAGVAAAKRARAKRA